MGLGEGDWTAEFIGREMDVNGCEDLSGGLKGQSKITGLDTPSASPTAPPTTAPFTKDTTL